MNDRTVYHTVAVCMKIEKFEKRRNVEKNVVVDLLPLSLSLLTYLIKIRKIENFGGVLCIYVKMSLSNLYSLSLSLAGLTT